MASGLLTYDIKETSHSVHSLLKKCLIEQYKFTDALTASDKKQHKLPNTTLSKQNTSHAQVVIYFQAACAIAGATKEKCFACEYNSATIGNY